MLRRFAPRGRDMTARISTLAIALLFALPLPIPAHAQLKTEVVTVNVRPGVTMRYFRVADAAPPKAAVILLAGGNGALKLSPSGTNGSGLSLNFLIRSRNEFARQGLVVAALDTASDYSGGMNGLIRLSRQHAQDIGKVTEELKKQTGVPVWLVGTSAGTLSAAGTSSQLAQSPSRPHGVILTSTMTVLDAAGHCGKSVYDAPLAQIKSPVLIVSHRDDGCACSPGGSAAGARLLAALSGASAKEHQIYVGGDPPLSGPCDARSPHGYFGIEGRVVKAIADWIASH